MDILIIVIVILLIFVLFLLVSVVLTLRNSQSEQLKTVSFVSQSLQAQSAAVNERIDRSSQIMSNLQKEIGQMTEIGRTMSELQMYIHNPKMRGALGEHILSVSLEHMLPSDMYSLQYPFSGGEIVDAVVRVGDYIVPIDAKFPVHNMVKMQKTDNKQEQKELMKLFERDVEKHMRAISTKYIRADQKTVDYAVMYVPSEAVYYEVVNSTHLANVASELRIMTVSPMTFYAFLRAVLMSTQGIRIQKQAKEILAVLESMRREYGAMGSSLQTLDRHVTNAYNQVHEINKSYLQLGQRFNHARSLTTKETDES